MPESFDEASRRVGLPRQHDSEEGDSEGGDSGLRQPATGDDYSRSARCEVCLLSPGLCVCAELPQIHIDERFFVIRHATELDKHSNTGGLVPHLLPGSQLLDHGVPEGPFDRSLLAEPDTQYQILYPGPRSEVLRPTAEQGDASSRPRVLIVLDGTWRKARRMLLRITELRTFPLVHLPPVGRGSSTERSESKPRLRKPPQPGFRYTLEAVHEAVNALGYKDESRRLEAFTRKVIERRFHSRGKIPRSALPGEDPI